MKLAAFFLTLPLSSIRSFNSLTKSFLKFPLFWLRKLFNRKLILLAYIAMSDSKGTGTNSLFLPLRRSFYTKSEIKIFSIKSGNKKNKFCSGTFCLKSSNDFCKIFEQHFGSLFY